MIVISWNCQGMGSRESLRVLMDMIHSKKPDILVLFETKINGEKADCICARLHFEQWARIECYGLSGGLWLFWKASIVSLEILESDPQFFYCRVDEGQGKVWLVMLVYGSPSVTFRQLLWDSVRRIGMSCSNPWVLLGDFNAVLYADERSSGLLGQGNKDRAFCSLVDEMGLVDLGFSGPLFTWSRGISSDHFVGARLDRGLCNMD